MFQEIANTYDVVITMLQVLKTLQVLTALQVLTTLQVLTSPKMVTILSPILVIYFVTILVSNKFSDKFVTKFGEHQFW